MKRKITSETSRVVKKAKSQWITKLIQQEIELDSVDFFKMSYLEKLPTKFKMLYDPTEEDFFFMSRTYHRRLQLQDCVKGFLLERSVYDRMNDDLELTEDVNIILYPGDTDKHYSLSEVVHAFQQALSQALVKETPLIDCLCTMISLYSIDSKDQLFTMLVGITVFNETEWDNALEKYREQNQLQHQQSLYVSEPYKEYFLPSVMISEAIATLKKEWFKQFLAYSFPPHLFKHYEFDATEYAEECSTIVFDSEDGLPLIISENVKLSLDYSEVLTSDRVLNRRMETIRIQRNLDLFNQMKKHEKILLRLGFCINSPRCAFENYNGAEKDTRMIMMELIIQNTSLASFLSTLIADFAYDQVNDLNRWLVE